MREYMLIIAISSFVMSSGSQVQSDASDHQYKYGDPVPLYASKTGPHDNPR